MACSIKSISKEELVKVYRYVNGFLLEEMNAGKPYSMEMLKARSLVLYNKIVSLMEDNVNGGKIKAADYVSTIPDVVLDVIHTYFDDKSGEKKLFNHAMNSVFPWAEVYSLVKNINDLPTKERIRFIESWLGIGPTEASELEEKQQIADDIELQKKQQLEGNAATTAAPGGVITVDDINIKTLQNEGEEFAAVPSTVLKSAGNEKVNGSEQKDMNPRKVFYFKVIRSLLKLVSGTNGNDSRNSVTNGASGIHIMFVSARQAMKMGLGDYTIDNATHYYAVPVSSTGEILYFEPVNGENVSGPELGTPIMFAIPRIGYDSQTNTYYFEGKADRDKWLDKTIRSYARHNKVTMEEARIAVQTEMGYNYAIAQRLRQNPEDMSIMGYINGGGRGYILNDVNVRTSVSSINFTDGPQSYTIAVDTQGAIDPEKKGTSYLTTNDVGQGRPLRIWLPKLDADTIETVATLFTTPIISTEDNSPISFQKRRDLLDQFINRMGISNRVTLNWDSLDKPEFRLTIDNEKMDLSTAEGIEKAKEKLRSILGNQYLIISNKLSSSQGYDPVNIEKTSGVSVKYTPSTSNYYQFLERKGIYLNYKTDENNRLALYNPYLSFGMDMSVMNELSPFMTAAITEFQKPEERQPAKVEQKDLLDKYKAKLIYGTPGVGKTTAIGMNPNLVDMDDLLVEEIKKVKGNTTFGVPYADVTNETVGVFLESLFSTNNDEAELIYEDVYDKAMDLIEKEGKTVLTGSHRFAAAADVLFLNDNIEDLSVTLLDKGKSIGSNMISAVNTILASQQTARGIEGKTVVDMDGKFMSDVLFEEVPITPTDKKAEIERKRDERIAELDKSQGYRSQSDQAERIKIQEDYLAELAAIGEGVAPFTEGNEEALKMLEELGEANFNKIMANHPELGTYDTKDVDEFIAEPTDDVSWNIKNEALIDYLDSDNITYQRLKNMLAKQDAYGQSGIELFDQDYNYIRSITLRELMDLIMDDIAQVKPELVYKNLQQIPFTYDMPDSTIPPVEGGLDPSMFDNEEIYKLATQKAGEIKATPEQIKAAEEWYNNSPLKQYIPFQVIFKAINSNPSAVAQWTRDGVILTKRADFTDYYHEAFHAFIHTFMTKEQLDGLFEATRMLPGTFIDYNGDRVAFDMATEKQLEEFLAEGFRNYMLDPGKYKFNSKEEKSIFQWLINVLRMLFEDVTWDMLTRDTIDTSTMIYDLYEKLRVGDLTGYSFQTENAVFDRTNNGMVALDENDPVSKIDWASTYEIVRSMDSLISEYGDVEALIKNKMIDFVTLAKFNQIRDRKYSKLAMHKTFTPEEEKLWLTVNNMIAAQREKEGGFSIGILKNKKMRSNFYSYIRSRFIDKINFYNQALTLIAEGTPLRAEIQKKIDTLQWSVRNFGDKDFLDSNVVTDSFGNIRGVIGYHMMNTDLFDRADKEAFIENIDINEDDIYVSMAENGRIFDEGGNTMSIIERADADILYLLHSLYEPTADTATTFVPKVNTLGFAEIMPFDRVWNNIVRLLENMDDRIDMYNAIKNEIQNFPAYGQLLSKLGTPQIGKEIKPQIKGVAPVYEQSPNFNMKSFTIWNKMLQTFDNVHIPLIQTTIHETFDIRDGVRASEPVYTVTAGTASAVYKRVGERWESAFQEMVPSITNFIGRTVENNNILMTGRAYAFPQLVLASTPDQFIEFMNKIGISLSDSQSIKSAIRFNDGIKRDIIAMQAKVRKIAEYNSNEANKDKILISSINSLINVEKPDVGNISSGIKKLSSVYTRLQELESRYSDFHSNFMVTNAEAEQQYEHTLQSTITRIVKVLNDTKKYPTFQTVIANPKMKYLDPANNYWAEISTVLNSLFILQDETGKPLSESDPRYGKRRVYPKTQEFVKIEVNNLSGIALLSEDQWKSGVANASSDTVSKLLSEIHNFAHIQTMEVMRHSDKKFSYAVGTDYVFANGKFGRTYVDAMEFLPGGSGMTNASNIIKQHLSAELKRINRFKSVDETGLVYDFRYLDRGKDFVLFKDMPVELEKRLLALSDDKSLMEHMAEDLSLNQDVSKYLRDWLTNLSNSLYNKLSGNMFFSLPYSSLVSPKVMIDAFVANNVIHNLESLVLIYGDPAMYALEKEEFHKRNSGAGGTGKISATDSAAINFINSANFNKDGYAISKLGRQNIQTRLYDGTLDTAILKDPIMRSAYYDSIAEYKKKTLEKRNKSAEEINEILYGKDGTHEKPTGGEMKPYAKMKVADAQGYITFDAYRMMRATQGRWSDIQETYYQRIIKGQPISQENLLEVFPPEKYQYWGQLDIKANLPGVVAMHKFALIPLIPTMIKDNTTLTMLHDKMMAEGVHYATFDSGSKIGTLTTERQQDTVFSDDQSMTIAPDFKTRPFTKNTIFSDYLKVQVEIAPEFKGEIALASQLRKIIEDGYMEGGVPTDFRMDVKDVNERIKLWNALTPQQQLDESDKYKEMTQYEQDLNDLFEAKKAELIEEMGIQLDDEGKISAGFENFINFVKRELNRREIGNHTINMIGVNEKGDLKMPLDLSLEADTIERILNNIISKRLVKFKVKGEHLIQVSNALFDNRSFTSKPGRNFEKATPEELEKYGTIDLPYYRVVEVNGKEKVRLAKCKIAITGDFYNLLYLNDKEGREIAVYDIVTYNGKKKRVLNRAASVAKLNVLLQDEEWLDIGDHRKMVTIAGPRIPVQGLNSAEAYEVYEFLPEESGPIIVTPAEIVAKSGSDFDKDTLFMLTPHIYRINGKVKFMDGNVKTSLTKEQIKEKLSNLYDQRKKLYAELYDKDARFNKLKDKLSSEEIQAYQNLKEEYIERKNELLGTINNLRRTLLKYAKGKIRLTSPESVKLDNQLYQAYVNLDILEYNFSKNRATYIGTFKEAAIEPLNNEIEKLTEQLYGLSSASKENTLLQRWVSMISNIDNYDALIRPNDTNIVKPVADELSKFNDVADGKKWMFRDDMTGIAATRILEIEYNMYKHESNNVGKQVLGIGAVDNTYNILLNRIGAYMNPFMAEGISQQRAQILHEKVMSGQPLTANERNEYNKANVFKQTIYLRHNTLDKVGGKAISLSHMYDADNKNRIGDVISQLINGWVDVAKDAWVFNLQGNKELAPTLLFMIQAGVPFETAAYFVSQPIIKEYVKQQRLAKSAFGRPLRLAPDQPNMFRNQARAKILTDSRYGFVNNKDLKFNVDKVSNVYKQRFPILQMAAEFVPKIMKEEGNEFSLEKLKEGVGKNMRDIDNFQRALFLHFLELEEMGKAMTELKTTTNVDTARTGTLYSAINRIIKLNKLEENPRIPGKEMLRNLKENSPIGSFFIQDFQLDRARDLFPIRASESTMEFIKKHAGKLKGDLKKTFGADNEEEFWQAYRNNMVSFIFQSTLYNFNPRELTVYRGARVDKNFGLAKVQALYQRVVVKEKDGKSTLYIDLKGIEDDFNTGAFAEGKLKPAVDAKVPFAALDRDTFDELSSIILDTGFDESLLEDDEMAMRGGVDIVKSRETFEEKQFRKNQAKRDQYVKFVIEREITRSQIPLSKAKGMFEYNLVLRFLDPKITENRDLVAYEEFLKNRALDNIFSPYKMFMSRTYNYAQTFFHIKNQFPQLAEQFRIFEALSMDGDRSKLSRNIRNLRLRNTRLTKNQINLYKENLAQLADPKVKKVDNAEDNAYISRFFAMMPFYGYIQAGLNANGRYSLNKILPPENFTRFMTSYVMEYGNYLDNDNPNLAFHELYYPAFVNAETVSGKRYSGGSRVKVYGIPMSLDYLSRLDNRPKDYVDKVLREEGFKQDHILTEEMNRNFPSYTTEWGMTMFRPSISIRNFSTTDVKSYVEYYNWLANNTRQDPTKGPNMFVHNALTNPQDVTMMNLFGDWFFNHPNVKATNKIGIPLMQYDMKTRKPVTFTDTIVNGVAQPNETLKQQIDEAIIKLKDLSLRNNLIFNANGYGLELQVSAPVTYLYLSEALAKNFGYVNPGAKSSPNSVKVIQGLESYYQQEMTYEEASELYQKCLS